jgi:hypothetical protein
MRFFFEAVDENLVVVDLDLWNFSLLNATAAHCWLSLLNTPSTVASVLQRQDTLDSEEGSAAFHRLIAAWDELGWIVRDGDLLEIQGQRRAAPLTSYQSVTAEVFTAQMQQSEICWSQDFDFDARTIGLDLYLGVDPIHVDFSPRARAFLSGIPVSAERAIHRIRCAVTSEGFYLTDGQRHVTTTDPGSALSRLILWVMYGAYGSEQFLGTLHAATVGRGDGAIIIPAISGAGKSTLTAYLVARGWQYGGDDLVGLGTGPDEVRVLPMPSAISVKAGSVPVLLEDYPVLSTLPEVAYSEKIARFLVVDPGKMIPDDQDSRRPLALVFPCYGADQRTELLPISSSEALMALVDSGIRTGERLQAEGLAHLVRFIDEIPKYRMPFCTLEEAEACLKSL